MRTLANMKAPKIIGEKFNFRWQQTMLRIKDPKITIPFYEKNFGMRQVHKYDFPENKFSIYFLESPHCDSSSLLLTDEQKEQLIWNSSNFFLELTHNHGSETDANFKVNNGNEAPYRGFGHIAFNTRSLTEAVAKCDKNGVRFKKRPEDGKMRNIAFALDPDGYWIELCERASTCSFREEFNLSQTMLRIKDPEKSLNFYQKVLGMRLLREADCGDFSLYFLASLPVSTQTPSPKSPEARIYAASLWQPVLELTHNHGTEKQEDFKYHSGNEQPQGFGHTGFLCDDLEQACKELEDAGISFRKRPQEGSMRGIAFIYDPDGYSVELIQRGVSFIDKK